MIVSIGAEKSRPSKRQSDALKPNARDDVLQMHQFNDQRPDPADEDESSWFDSASLSPSEILGQAENWLEEFLLYRCRGCTGMVDDQTFSEIAERLTPIAEHWGIDSTPISQVMNHISSYKHGLRPDKHMSDDLVLQARNAVTRIEEKSKFLISKSLSLPPKPKVFRSAKLQAIAQAFIDDPKSPGDAVTMLKAGCAGPQPSRCHRNLCRARSRLGRVGHA
jgi:hypothetical protein